MWLFEKVRKSEGKSYRVYRSALGLALGLHGRAACDIASIHELCKRRIFENVRKYWKN